MPSQLNLNMHMDLDFDLDLVKKKHACIPLSYLTGIDSGTQNVNVKEHFLCFLFAHHVTFQSYT